MLARRNRLARGIYNRLREDGRIVDQAAPNEVQYCLNPTLNPGKFLAHRLVRVSNPADLYSLQENDADSNFVWHTAIASQLMPL